MRWYVIQAYSGYENQVMKALKEYVARAGLDEFFGEIIVPSEEVVDVRDGKKRKSERKFFPGYVLVQMDMNDDTWHLVKNTPKVIGFIGGTGDRPMPITEKEASHILNRMAEAEEGPKLKVLFEVGESVRVTDGPFAEFNGVVEEVLADKGRLIVSVMIFGRATPVELEFFQVEKS
ncbi:transcription termination/antitermination protein NusG [Wohlfahrtiimonas chitiniclastica]|uniref:Transcription termination/antitermination protein NusG n=2 Tax=Wohlfahrtiimonas chitiniclastica TaxID=400946 RepID=L8Y034_9GAMM|nr:MULTISPECIES: transcription termination/antitermination protein NusG [Wohlfahrtiimonas]ELV08360.1 Transcription antitermination protein NusG [Wohlfahrtiimonas chitiniclastica SH04]KZX37372.1 transcription termination/antitermination protein NusG [Wohlfahrtiimonas chitiniclastica]MBS7814188.1 transcription termination/antitermination protein NusG [Wohlfahrtiimonas chitiniclastica]MBS7816728.1 transcription termination/antitermination protein NusG [Wohlfahrtiimonas chitiniclastica]MBS7818205.